MERLRRQYCRLRSRPALAAAHSGLPVAILEKTAHVGGSMACIR
jgi:succinate dehydrogenase/fumarate reductase flavoprotein subunit